MLPIQAKSAPVIPWRSLFISLTIAITIAALLIVLINHVKISTIVSERSSPTWAIVLLYIFVAQFPIAASLGGIYLNFRVKDLWLESIAIYFVVLCVATLVYLILQRSGLKNAWYELVVLLSAFPVILLAKTPARSISKRVSWLGPRSDESFKFGMSTMLWSSSFIAILLFVLLWIHKLDNYAYVQHSLKNFIARGVAYNFTTNRLVFDSKICGHGPVGLHEVVGLSCLQKKISLEFIDCEIADETIAFLKANRTSFKAIQFSNCQVVRESAQSSQDETRNELNEPLPRELPR